MGSAAPERGGGFLDARAVMRRYGWGKTKGYQSLNNRDLVPPPVMSLLGLVRHLVEAERDWCNWVTDGTPLPKIYGLRDADFDNAIADQDIVDAAGAALTRESELACIGPACDARVERGHLVVRAGAARKPRLATSGPTPRDGQADRTTSSPQADPCCVTHTDR